MIKVFLLLVFLAPAVFGGLASGTVTRAVMTDTNGVLIGASTNFPALNGLATVLLANSKVGTNQIGPGLIWSNSLLRTTGQASVTNVFFADIQGIPEQNAVLTNYIMVTVSGEISVATNGFVTASITNGLGGGSMDYGVTNGLASTSYVAQAVSGLASTSSLGSAAYSNADAFASAAQGALADTALQAEVDTPNTVFTRDTTMTNASGRVGGFYSVPVSQVFPNIDVGGWPFGWASEYQVSLFRPITNWFVLGTVELGGTNLGSFYRVGEAEEGPNSVYRMHDEQNFRSGIEYLSPSGSGSALSDITALQVGALSTNGGTVDGAVYTTRESGWAGNEFITANALGARGATNIVSGAANGYNEATRILTHNGVTNVAANGTLGAVSNGVSWLTIAAGGGAGNVHTASNNVFTGTAPISRTTSNAADQWIIGSLTNVHYLTATSDVTRINGTNYVFQP